MTGLVAGATPEKGLPASRRLVGPNPVQNNSTESPAFAATMQYPNNDPVCPMMLWY
jgi:hypothetical protein